MVSLRPITEADLPFLRALYASTRAEELVVLPWSAAQKRAFLDDQFAAQHSHYQRHYQGASFELLLDQGNAIGRLYVMRCSEEIRVIDIALLPEYRQRGIGAELLQGLLAEASASGRCVAVHVEKFNPARRLYQRLGFQPAEDRGAYDFMVCKPAPGTVEQ